MKLLHLILALCSIVPLRSIAQQDDWTASEKRNYQNIRSICEYYKDKRYDSTQRSFVFDKFIYFDNILNDTSAERKQSRLPKFDALFSMLLHFVDSVGLENLDARPTRFFSNQADYFAPFDKERELHEALPFCLTYFDKRKPDVPLGTLVFEEETHKMYAWIVISQGSYHYFLTFALL